MILREEEKGRALGTVLPPPSPIRAKKDENEGEDAAERPLKPRTLSRSHRITGVHCVSTEGAFRATSPPPGLSSSGQYLTTASPETDCRAGGLLFPGKHVNSVCGKLALMSPISTAKILELLEMKLVVDDAVNVKAFNTTVNWLRECFGEESIPSCDGAACNHCGCTLKAYNFRIRCAECADYDLCEKCFTLGAESEGHSKYHPYIPIGFSQLPLFSKQWLACEEAILLDAVGRYGFGNWGEVADWVAAVGSANNPNPKDKDMCRKRYFDFHLSNKTLSQATWAIQNIKSPLLYDSALAFTHALLKYVNSDSANSASANSANANSASAGANCCKTAMKAPQAMSEMDENCVVDYSPLYDEKGWDLVNSSIFRPNVEVPEFPAGDEWEAPKANATIYHQVTKPAAPLPPRVSILGYMPNRGDFDTEWDNNAELDICDIEIKDTDSPMEKEAKLAAIESYNTILDDRWLRKRLYIDRSVHDAKLINNKLSKHPELKDFNETIRPLWRYIWTNYSEYPAALFTKGQQYHEGCHGILASDIDDLPELLLDDKLLIERLDLLTAWKLNGLSTLQDVLQHGDSVFPLQPAANKYWVMMSSQAKRDPHEWVRESLWLKDQAYTQLMTAIGEQVSEAFGESHLKEVDGNTQLIDFVVDAQVEKLADSKPPHVERVFAPDSSEDGDEGVEEDGSTTGAGVIPKKRRLVAGEEGEIVG